MSASYYTMADAARRKGVSYHTVSRAVRSGLLPVNRLGRQVLIDGRDLDEWTPMVMRRPRKYRDAIVPDYSVEPAIVGQVA